MSASFNGQSLGLIFRMSTSANPPGCQVNAYCGANGLEYIAQGSRGGTTVVEGALSGYGPAGLAAAMQSLRSLQVNAGAYVLVDDEGTSWASVVLREFRPVGRTTPLVGVVPGTYGQRYEAEFLHLV